jgi:uncharacterized protein
MTCPICDRETIASFRPFCSKRCADLDLGKWLSGVYAVPIHDLEDDEIPDQIPRPDEQTRH